MSEEIFDLNRDIMAPGASKEASPDKVLDEEAQAALLKSEAEMAGKSGGSSSSGDGMITIFYSFIKKLATVGIIYCVGYYGLSFAWLFTPIVLTVARDEWRKKKSTRREVAKASAIANDKEVILARLDDLPAWVFFPDVERCEWLNKILKQCWPNANHFTRNLIKTSIEPLISKAMAGYKLNGFKFERIILGTIPPRIGGVKVYDKNVARNEIIMDLDLFYAGDCDFSFSLGGMRGGIKDFQIHGMVRVIMKPLISKMPLIGGLQIFFLNNPNIDFNLVGVVDVLDMPGLSDILRRIIVEQVAAVMVLPNKLPIILNDEVPAFSLKMPEPEGVLRIHVVEAKDLMKKDISVLGKGKSDPYAIVTVGAQQFRTHIIDNNVNPKWDFWCEANVYAENGQTVTVQLYDKDEASEDERLGRATIEISSVTKRGQVDTWLTLEDAKHGLVHLRLTWLTLSSDRNDLRAALEETQMLRVTAMSTAVLTVFIDSAKNLPQARQQSQPDPYLKLSVGKKSEQTSTQMRTNEPVWEQGFTFLVGNPDNDTLQLKIIDQKTETEIGRLVYILSNIMEKGNLELVSQPFQLQKSGPESKIIMSMALRILRRGPNLEEDSVSEKNQLSNDSNTDSNLSRAGSLRTGSIAESAGSLKKQDSKMSSSSGIGDSISIAEEPIFSTSVGVALAAPIRHSPDLIDTEGMTLLHRSPSTSSSAGSAGLGRIQLTLRYSVQRQRLIVIVHKIVNIPLKDPSNIPDPYVKLYLLPGRSKDSKRKTNVVKDECNPIYDATFEYVISSAELHTSELEVTVCTQKGFLSGGSPVIGMNKITLNDADIALQGVTSFFDLYQESKFD